MDVPVAHASAAVPLAFGATEETPAAALRDPAELLDLDVDQVAGRVMHVGADLLAGPLDPDPGRGVGPGQRRASVAAQDLVHSRDRQSEPVGDSGWSRTMIALGKKPSPLATYDVMVEGDDVCVEL